MPGPGEYLVRTLYLSVAPVMRQYMIDGAGIESLLAQSVSRRRFFVAVAAHDGDFLAGNGVPLLEPLAQVDELAALAAERAVTRGGRPLDGSLAGGAGDGLHAQVQVVSVKRTSSVVWTGRLFASCQTRNRTLQR